MELQGRREPDDSNEPMSYAGPPPQAPPLSDRLKKAFGPVVAVFAGLAKFGAIVFKIKALAVLITMGASIAAYALFYGWQFAVGFVLLIFVHEMGHVVALRARGIKAGAPIFLPFLGAFVSMKSAPRSVYEEAESALAGPVVGTVGAFGVAYAGQALDSDLLRALALTGFLLNLFNLLPALPLDGGRVAGALNPKLWFLGLVGLLSYEFYRPSPVVPVILLLGGYELYRRFRGRDSAASRQYFALTREQRLRIGAAYVGLILVLVYAVHANQLPDTSPGLR